jgi:phosphatidylserine/phosphatidylglycerophosphate/cardiolipin synthase-like enzyme
MNKICDICGDPISDKVADYSRENCKMFKCIDCQNGYHKFDNCRVYIGTEAGNKGLLWAIKNAKKSVDIVSPYLSSNLIAELTTLAQRRIKVRLFTNFINDDKGIGCAAADDRESYLNTIRKMIRQTKHTDVNAQEEIKKLKHKLACKKRQWNVINIVNIFLTLSIPYMCLLLHSYWPLFLIIPIIALWKNLKGVFFKKILLLKIKIINTRIYSYEYSFSFDFYMFEKYNEIEKNTTIHSKIYIIDNKVAYLGSLNFTTSGICFNHEVIVKIEDSKVNYIANELDELINEGKYTQVNRETLAKQIYSEPINDECISYPI